VLASACSVLCKVTGCTDYCLPCLQAKEVRADDQVRQFIQPLKEWGGAAAQVAKELETVLSGAGLEASGGSSGSAMISLQDLSELPGGRHDNDHADFRYGCVRRSPPATARHVHVVAARCQALGPRYTRVILSSPGCQLHCTVQGHQANGHRRRGELHRGVAGCPGTHTTGSHTLCTRTVALAAGTSHAKVMHLYTCTCMLCAGALPPPALPATSG
jgi:hypothetical protein